MKTKEGSAIELQAEEGGFIEFETPKWHRRWSDIKDRIQEAVDMPIEMEKIPFVVDKSIKDSVGYKIDELKKSRVGQDKRTWERSGNGLLSSE